MKKNIPTALKVNVVRVVVFFALVSGMFITDTKGVRADQWGANWSAAIMKHTMETIRRNIEGTLLGSLKIAAIQMLNSQVGQLIGGNSLGQALFITNFNDFLYQNPTQRTNLYMNDFFTLTTRGRGSSANYIGVGDTGNIGGSYPSYLVSTAKQATMQGGGANTYNLNQYTPSPTVMFAEGDWRAFNAFFSNPANNPYGYSLQAERAYQGKLAQEQHIATVKALSPGFLPAEKNGTVIAPAGAIGAITTNVQDLPNKMIASAENPTELLSGVVAATANRMITGLIQNGIGQIQANIQREIGSVSGQIGYELNSITGSLGPAAGFAQDVLQRTTARTSATTPAPPDNGTGGP